MNNDQKPTFQLNQIFELVDKILEFQSKHLFDQEWGTEKDWRKLLNIGHPNSTLIINFVKLLISTRILIKNKEIIKNGQVYTAYKLHRNHKKMVKVTILESSPEYIYLNKRYTIYD